MGKELLRDQVKQAWLRICETAKKIGDAAISEADTRAYFIDPLLRALGWSGIEDVERERSVPAGGIVDYVLKINGADKVLVEAKSLRSSLTEKDAAQLLNYANTQGVRWCILTNGEHLRLYDQFKREELKRKLIFEIDLQQPEEDFDRIFDSLWLISKAGIGEGHLERHVRALDMQRHTKALIRDEKSLVIGALAAELRKIIGSRVSRQEARTVLAQILTVEHPRRRPEEALAKEPEWTEDELRRYLGTLHKWSTLTYNYYKFLASHPGKISRSELLSSLEKLQGKALGGRVFAGIFGGISKTWEKEDMKGKEKLDRVSEDKQEFLINEKYRDRIQKVISSLETQ